MVGVEWRLEAGEILSTAAAGHLFSDKEDEYPLPDINIAFANSFN